MSLTYTDNATAVVDRLKDGSRLLVVCQGDVEISVRLSPSAFDELKESMA